MANPHPFFLLCSCLLLLAGSREAAAAGFDRSVQSAYQELLKLKIERGRVLSGRCVQAAPNNAAALLVANYGDFLPLCLQQDPEQYDHLLQAQENRLSQLQKIPSNTAWAAYAKAEVQMHIGLSKLLYGNRLSAAWDIRKAYLLYADNAQRYPSFLPNKKCLGLLQVLIGSVPDQYKWFLDVIGMKGSIPEGLSNLKAAATQPNPFQEEAQLYYTLVLPLLEEERNSLPAARQAQELSRQHPDNLLHALLATFLLKKARQGEAALASFVRHPTGRPYLQVPYLHHLAADLYLYRGDYDSSVQENKMFLAETRGKHYLKAANFKLYLAFLLSQHAPQAQWYYQRVSEAGAAETEEDNYAANFVERKEVPNQSLLLARLRSDGGYYRQALAALQQFDSTTNVPVAVKAEYLYRKARIYHGLQQLPQAIRWYERTINFCRNTSLYFAPHAALQLGYLYQKAGQPEKARSYFQQALRYKGHPYKNSIDAKAKLALTSLPVS